MSSAYQPFDSLPPRKLQLHHRFILLSSGASTQMGWIFLGMGSFFTLLFGIIAAASSMEDFLFPFLFSLLFPLVGLLLLFGALKRNFKTIDLLTNGKFARGKVIDQQATNLKINEQTVFEYTVRFQADNGQEYEVKGKTHHSGVVGDEEKERVLYLSADPKWGTVYDTIPNKPEFLSSGQIKPPHWMQLLTLIIPTIGLIAFLALILGSFAGIRLLINL